VCRAPRSVRHPLQVRGDTNVSVHGSPNSIHFSGAAQRRPCFSSEIRSNRCQCEIASIPDIMSSISTEFSKAFMSRPGGPGIHWQYLRMGFLEHHFTMLYLEPIGTGGSGRLAEHPHGYTVERFAKQLGRFLETLDSSSSNIRSSTRIAYRR